MDSEWRLFWRGVGVLSCLYLAGACFGQLTRWAIETISSQRLGFIMGGLLFGLGGIASLVFTGWLWNRLNPSEEEQA